jgi:hypothetical protein
MPFVHRFRHAAAGFRKKNIKLKNIKPCLHAARRPVKSSGTPRGLFLPPCFRPRTMLCWGRIFLSI